MSYLAKLITCFLSITVSASALAEEPAFMTGFWCGPPAKFLSLERLREVKEANFTVVFPPCGSVSFEENRKILDYCKELGLRALIQDGRMVTAIGSDPANKSKLD